MKTIAILAFEGISLFHLSVPAAIFKDAYGEEQSPFSLLFCAEHGDEIATSSGIKIEIPYGLEQLQQADILIFPSWIPQQIPSTELLQVIKNAHDSNKLIVGLCLGSYLLAHAGILNGKSATTHWAYGEDFSNRFNQVNYLEDPLYITQGNLITSAGTAAAIDCCLNLLKEQQGSKVANQVSRIMVAAPQRGGGQKQFVARPVITNSSDQRINKFISKVLENLTENYSIKEAAERCLMSSRTFSRNFKKSFAMSFIEWLTQARLNYSQQLLENSTLSIGQVSEQAGFSSEQNFRKQFKQSFSVAPKEWRRLFNSSKANQNN